MKAKYKIGDIVKVNICKTSHKNEIIWTTFGVSVGSINLEIIGLLNVGDGIRYLLHVSDKNVNSDVLDSSILRDYGVLEKWIKMPSWYVPEKYIIGLAKKEKCSCVKRIHRKIRRNKCF